MKLPLLSILSFSIFLQFFKLKSFLLHDLTIGCYKKFWNYKAYYSAWNLFFLFRIYILIIAAIGKKKRKIIVSRSSLKL